MSVTYELLLKDCANYLGLVESDHFVLSGLLSLAQHQITLEYNGAEDYQEFLVIHTQLGKIAPTKESLMELLIANKLWQGTGGATLGIDKSTAQVFLCYQQRFDGLSGADLGKILIQFAEVASHWKTVIN